MTPYIFDPIDYKGQEIQVKATTGAGSVTTSSGTAQTTAMRFYLNDVLMVAVSVTADRIAQQFADGVQALKDEIDNLDEAAKILIELGATEDGSLDTVDTPTGFAASQPGGAGTDISLVWDVIGPIELYEIQRGALSDYSDAFTISEGDTTPYSIPFPGAGMTYLRIRAKIAGMTDSDWAETFIDVL